jgi:porphobilinogen synthase
MINYSRNRRLRTTASLRSLVQETTLSTNDFVMPLFVLEGKNRKEAIPSMPGIIKQRMELTVKECKE